MPAAAEPQPAALPLPGGRDGATVRLVPLLTGEVRLPPGWLHRRQGLTRRLRALGVGVPGRDWVTVPIVAFLLEHPGAGPVLVDTGFHPSVAVDPRQNLGPAARLARGLRMDPHQAVTAQLRARGIAPGDVRTVVLTHLHPDHASAIAEFPGATFVLDAREWAAATAPRALLHGYLRRQFDHAFDFRLVNFDGPQTASHASFGRSLDLFGDGSVRLVATPGHTLGHLSVVARLAEREALLAGDAIYTMRTLRAGTLPERVEDEHVFRRSLREIQLYEEQRPDALIVPGHDMAAWAALEPAY